ncbi:MAG TPA: SDR family NAD(P)-dependent oxidoreductase [Acidimicrobiia bacterium]
MKVFEGRVAVVTGGASGIGLALAHRFGRAGMKVVLGDVEAPALERAVAELASVGVDATGVPCDVTDPAQMDALARAALDAHGAVHVFCNNAGVGGGGLSWEAPLSTWEWVLGVNLWGVIHGVRTFVPILLQQDESHIVNTASVAGLTAAPFMGPYNASKHAVVAISETLHHELALTGARTRVSVLCPGWVNTGIATSERNRPAHLTVQEATDADAAQAETMRGMLQTMIESGMSPDRVADQVFDAISDERFWILTHSGDGDDAWTVAVNRRLDSIRDQTNPAMNLLA